MVTDLVLHATGSSVHFLVERKRHFRLAASIAASLVRVFLSGAGSLASKPPPYSMVGCRLSCCQTAAKEAKSWRQNWHLVLSRTLQSFTCLARWPILYRMGGLLGTRNVLVPNTRGMAWNSSKSPLGEWRGEGGSQSFAASVGSEPDGGVVPGASTDRLSWVPEGFEALFAGIN